MMGMFSWIPFHHHDYGDYAIVIMNGHGPRFRGYQLHAPRRRRWGIGAKVTKCSYDDNL